MSQTPQTPSKTPSATTELANLVPFFRAFCHETRASIVEQLMSGEKCVCEITAHLGMSQPLISHHLAILRDTGFVTMRGQGARTYYALDWASFDKHIDEFVQAAQQLRAQDTGFSCACC
jgi:DNA-binding transcriptional ArsR family regulator